MVAPCALLWAWAVAWRRPEAWAGACLGENALRRAELVALAWLSRTPSPPHLVHSECMHVVGGGYSLFVGADGNLRGQLCRSLPSARWAPAHVTCEGAQPRGVDRDVWRCHTAANEAVSTVTDAAADEAGGAAHRRRRSGRLAPHTWGASVGGQLAADLEVSPQAPLSVLRSSCARAGAPARSRWRRTTCRCTRLFTISGPSSGRTYACGRRWGGWAGGRPGAACAALGRAAPVVDRSFLAGSCGRCLAGG